LIDLRQRHKDATAEELPGLDFLAGYALGQRSAVGPQLASLDDSRGESFAEYTTATLEEVRPPDEGSTELLDLARTMLGELMGKLQEAASGDLKDYDHLHQVRIAGKRLRYAVEVFADCFAPALREQLYPMIEEMQEILGRANDSHVASQRLIALRTTLKGWDEMWERIRPGLEGLLRFHQRRLPLERRRFLKCWEQWCALEPASVLAEPSLKTDPKSAEEKDG
jgi:hypothetical protein